MPAIEPEPAIVVVGINLVQRFAGTLFPCFFMRVLLTALFLPQALSVSHDHRYIAVLLDRKFLTKRFTDRLQLTRHFFV
ncbi:hypothetical protein WL88_28945 [Burkholderia diffusa]|uniref:Secreted protein n=1 Tax=Burkholderia diffusa TaxID=488732 RepID=A0AAW3PAX2_9BURK|nr:hypothetical protein WJ39_27135 [Burkholderia diffusa]KVN02976.1 hypothetical protein WJ62_11520 [Burkholderia diffusa]KWF41376.1 hypothetical protein WL85_00140 [Burkholderia diffusa]KWF44202.1 hypothetical protein WL86_08575 [Burkholderia diffusa]KWF45110.1 hypothetical protein WL88_28945 [Burkholderia diffusa]